ncbi:hypothetical protein NLI96_g5795 [Meripilus lineatus]|uniref:Uncharacterized protein n=1 Tax=Meripilus lineatus TaxID=2056292 RepID=A0AAD5YGL6_9APHY|nr:hypothetical protein NLI96_g5795 [Physisporinus lineatus]
MSTFTPTDVVDMAKEKDWAANIGMMDWDNTKIVFTKRTLIEFLRYTGTTVDTNFSNIQKLPKYATFGKLSGDAPATEASASAEPVSSTGTWSMFSEFLLCSRSTNLLDAGDSSGQFRPSRRVRTAPGGDTHDLFGHYVDDDALANAPPKGSESNTSIADSGRRTSGSIWDPPDNNNTRPQFKPTRR